MTQEQQEHVVLGLVATLALAALVCIVVAIGPYVCQAVAAALE